MSLGAMRECYRAQKLGNFSLKSDWKYASNVVLKKYIEDVDKSVLFEDITLQMESKLWANEYNRRNPPKKIDVMQICIVQLIGTILVSFWMSNVFFRSR
jgi:elongation factor 2 kinase